MKNVDVAATAICYLCRKQCSETRTQRRSFHNATVFTLPCVREGRQLVTQQQRAVAANANTNVSRTLAPLL